MYRSCKIIITGEYRIRKNIKLRELFQSLNIVKDKVKEDVVKVKPGVD